VSIAAMTPCPMPSALADDCPGTVVRPGSSSMAICAITPACTVSSTVSPVAAGSGGETANTSLITRARCSARSLLPGLVQRRLHRWRL
jgi:hypothetical protein